MPKTSFNRIVLATSIDGRITFPHRGKGDLGGKGDRNILEKALAWSDATLMGSKTLKIHKNTCIIRNKELIEKRITENRSPQPLSIIVSKKNSFSSTLDFFDQPIKRGLLSPNPKNRNIKEFDYYFLMKQNWSETIKALNNEGYQNILILGGINLIESILMEDQIDEIQLTLTPRLIGGEYTWISPKMNNLPEDITKINSWKLEVIERLIDNELMLKYSRKRY